MKLSILSHWLVLLLFTLPLFAADYYVEPMVRVAPDIPEWAETYPISLWPRDAGGRMELWKYDRTSDWRWQYGSRHYDPDHWFFGQDWLAPGVSPVTGKSAVQEAGMERQVSRWLDGGELIPLMVNLSHPPSTQSVLFASLYPGPLATIAPRFFWTGYYVDETDGTASDSNDGSIGSPWLTIGKCASTLVAGDTCNIKDTAGTYSGTTESTSGSMGNRITYQCLGTNPSFTSDFVLDDGTEYITYQDCNSAGINVAFGDEVQWIEVLNNAFAGGGPIVLVGDHILVEGNSCDSSCSGDYMNIHAADVAVVNNTTILPTISPGFHYDFLQSFCVPDTSGGRSLTTGVIEGNLMQITSQVESHFWLTNDTINCDQGPLRLRVRYNIWHDTSGDFPLYINDSGAAASSDNSVYNNSFFNSDDVTSWIDWIAFYDASDSSLGFNNLCYDCMFGTSNWRGWGWGSGGSNYNNLYDASSGTVTFSSPASTESGAVKNEDPLLTDPDNNDFTLDSMSPAIDAGAPVATVDAADSGTGTTLVLVTAETLQDGHAGSSPDCIAVGSVSNIVCISSIDFGANEVTLMSSISRMDGDAVFLYSRADGSIVLYGEGTDIGAEEFQAAEPVLTGEPRILFR